MHPRRFAPLLLAAALVVVPGARSLPLAGQAPGDAPVPAGPVGTFRVDTFTLANGIRVAVSEDHSASVVAVSAWHDLRGPGDAGFRAAVARVIQGVLSEETGDRRAGGVDGLVEGAGGTADYEADLDHAAFRVVLPSNRLDLALWLQAAWLRPFDPEPGLLLIHRELVGAELARRGTEDPWAPLDAAAADLLASATGAPRQMPDPAVVARIGQGDVEDVHERWFAPANTTLAIVGDVDPTRARALAERYPGAVPERAAPERTALPSAVAGRRAESGDATGDGGDSPVALRTTLSPSGAMGRVEVAFPVPGSAEQKAPASAVLAALLGGPAGRLVGDLPVGVAGDARVSLARLSHRGRLLLGAAVPDGEAPDRVEAALLGVLERVASEGPAEAELRGARDRLRAAAAVRRLTVADRADVLQRGWLDDGDPGAALGAGALEAWDVVGRQDIEDLAAHLLSGEAVAVSAPATPPRSAGGGGGR